MRELIIDNFAGGGGASTGIEMALGVSPDYAINHDAVALAMHAANHPSTVHLQNNVWKVDPDAIEGPIGLAWFSPDCKHFSKAKGGKPVEKGIRDLAWVVVRWARRRAGGPRVIILENVEEFSTWGPLGADGRPCPERKGKTFKRWVSELRRLGYKVEWRELRACDYGAPTIRKRLFLIARRDGEPIIWPKPTHAAPESDGVRSGALQPWRTAAEIIDWSLPCPSIFDTAEEIMAKHGLRAQRPLQPATLARIAKGVKRYVLDAAKPFIVPITHTTSGDRVHSVDDPLRTITTARGGEQALVTPFAVPRYGERDGQEPRTRSLQEPMPVVVPTGNGASLIAPHLTKFRENSVGAPLDEPAPTVTANSFIKRPGGAAPIGVVAPVLSAYYGKGEGEDVRAAQLGEPLRTQTTENRHALVAPHLMTMRNAGKPFNGADQPAHTVTAGGAHMHLVAAFLAQHNYLEPGHDARTPLSTVVAKGSTQGVVAANLLRQFGTGVGSSLDEPARTVMADGGGKTQLSAAFLQKYYGADQDPRLEEPLHTATAKARFGVVTVTIDGEPYVITDIGMRMLTPRELFRAQGFPDSYVIDRGADGSPITKTQQVAKCGNSVCPPMAAALVKANMDLRVIAEEQTSVEFFLEAAE
ncbi:DNA methyltransferase [Rhodopseudomonas sp. BR0C11]|uniref:DNA cytosine methyltransferase n=1 Tax=Rhodopseudomonas sp. BR0C11 TaxID=2269370 RepID=UPI0013DEC9EA|nr:DNA cytosine methyltransferase [Rhodopseudomonas sp. BR0C11]NEV79290.1 DNA methyltransferase [Rhodopseudomonas sp. BR0C11]